MAQASFCHRCGGVLGRPPAAGRWKPARSTVIVVSVAAFSILGTALTAAFLSRPDRSPAPVTRMSDGGDAMPAVSQGAPASSVDISRMTPREAADRLFNRVMSASERGDQAEALRFAPMAVEAYGRVAELDADARYHVGVLHNLLGELDRSRQQIARLKEVAGAHLLALVLEHDIAVLSGDQALAARTAAEFTAAYESEMATGRPEYQAHSFSIDKLRTTITTSASAGPAPAADDGAALFASHCAACHGAGAVGTDQGPPLVHRIYEPGHHGDEAFYRAVSEGVRGHHWPFGDMAPVPGVSREDVGSIIAYVRGLQRAAGIE